MIDNHYDYLEKLLLLQSYAVEELKHNLSKGEMREEFLRDLILNQYNNIKCHRGFIVDKEFQSTQTDIIISNNRSSNINMGGQSLIYLDDVKMTIEVKTSGETKHLKDLEENAIEIKSRIVEKNKKSKSKNKPIIEHPKIGLFAYKFNLNKNNFLKKFGYRYNNEIESYERDKKSSVEFKNIDFISIFDFNDNDKENLLMCDSIFLTRNISDNEYIIEKDNPIKLLFTLIKSINEQ